MEISRRVTAAAKKKRFTRIRIVSFSVLSVVLLCFLLFGVLRFVYPEILRVSHRIGSPGIDSMEIVELGGIRQLLYFRGQDAGNPVILIVHGGPGSSMIPSLHYFQYEWEKDFTVVQWDQRNSGRTFFLNDPDLVLSTMTFERVVEDAHEVTQYIKQKLNKEKVILFGHSWGTVLGSALAQMYPYDYEAYIGVGQMINLRDNERFVYEAVLEMARKEGNQKDVDELEALKPYPLEVYNEAFFEKVMKVRKFRAKYRLTPGGMDLKSIIRPLTSPYARTKELINFSSFMYYQEPLLRFLIEEYDVRKFDTIYKIPVFYIMGENDYQTPYFMAKMYFDEISAPIKKFFSISNAGHRPMIDNKKEFIGALTNILEQLK